MKRFLAISVMAVFLMAFAACNEEEHDGAGPRRGNYFVTVLTGPTSGIFFPIGGAFSSHLRHIGYRTSVTATGATVENIRFILSGQGEMAIAMSDAVIQAIQAYGAFEGQSPATELRAMMGLWPNYVQIVTVEGSGIKSFEDMRGRRIGVGAPNSGVELNARMMFEAHGMTYADANVDFLSYGQAIEQMRNGLIDAAFVTSGLGNATIRELSANNNVAFVPVEGEGLRRLLELYPFFIESHIPAYIYGTAADTPTVSVMNIMLVSDTLPSNVVYDILESVYSEEGMETISASHSNALNHIMLSTALRGISGTVIPFHDGAVEFYRSRGMMN